MIYRDAATAILSCIRSKSYDPIQDYVRTLNDIDEEDWLGHTLLRYAVVFAKSNYWGILVVQYLIERGANPHYKDSHATTLLMEVAGRGGRVNCVSVLLGAGVDIQSVDGYGYTALRYAQGCDEDGHPYDSGYEKHPLVCELIRAEIAMRDEMKLAFAMAGHRRLGGETRMVDFDIEVLNMILNLHE